MPEPVGQTCPIIDGVISEITDAYKLIESLINEFDEFSPNDLKSEIKEALDKLSGLTHKNSPLEEIRDANSQLRSWGKEMENKAEELEKDFEDLESAYKDAQSELDYIAKHSK